jgi:hypothetical protein
VTHVAELGLLAGARAEQSGSVVEQCVSFLALEKVGISGATFYCYATLSE